MKKNTDLTLLEQKQLFFSSFSEKEKKRWYLKNHKNFLRRLKVLRKVKKLKKLNLPLHLSFLRWLLVDLLMGKNRKFWGIYQFVGLPGEGKTLSMVAHMERVYKDNPNVIIATNFGYVREHFVIEHWLDIIKVSSYARMKKKCCVIAIDEIHVTFDSADWQRFPAELLALLSFNRKFNLQFLCSAQIYDRIPKKIRDIANYTVICKNVGGFDRLFKNYYFQKDEYEATFEGVKKKAKFLREYIADDELYSLYDTLKHVDKMTTAANEEKDKRMLAFELLFGKEETETDAPTTRSV